MKFFRNILPVILLFVLLITGITTSFAQKKMPAAKATSTFVKFKAPKLHTSLGPINASGNSILAQAEIIIGLPLKIYDEKKIEYQISSYNFLYRKIGVAEDETGKLIPTSSISYALFKVTPLPKLWVDIIRAQVSPGEELLFFDIIVKDAKGRLMYAPELKISVQK